MSRTHRKKGTRAAHKTHGGKRHPILDSGGHSHKKFKRAGGSYSLFEGGRPQQADEPMPRSSTAHKLT